MTKSYTLKNKVCSCNQYYTCKTCRASNTYTYEQIGAMMGISRQMVQYIEKQALKKFRNNLKLLGYEQLEEIL